VGSAVRDLTLGRQADVRLLAPPTGPAAPGLEQRMLHPAAAHPSPRPRRMVRPAPPAAPQRHAPGRRPAARTHPQHRPAQPHMLLALHITAGGQPPGPSPAAKSRPLARATGHARGTGPQPSSGRSGRPPLFLTFPKH
jgi:hypothetical protein